MRKRSDPIHESFGPRRAIACVTSLACLIGCSESKEIDDPIVRASAAKKFEQSVRADKIFAGIDVFCIVHTLPDRCKLLGISKHEVNRNFPGGDEDEYYKVILSSGGDADWFRLHQASKYYNFKRADVGFCYVASNVNLHFDYYASRPDAFLLSVSDEGRRAKEEYCDR